MDNPFSPAPGDLPPALLGREAELAAIRENVRRATASRVPVPLVFTGQRGMGKTVLLREMRELPGDATVSLAIEIEPGQPLVNLVRQKLELLVGARASTKSVVERAIEAALRHVPKVSFELPHDTGAIALSASSDEDRPDLRSLYDLLAAAHEAARKSRRYLTLTIDEIQDADPAAMQTVVRFVHESAQTATPVLFACAGLPQTDSILKQMRTYVQRWDLFRLRLLTSDESAIAIRDPIVRAGLRIAEDALDLLVAESSGYPFFLQKFASAAWEHHHGKTISKADVDATLPDVKAKLEHAFYVDTFAGLTPRERLFVVTMAERGAGPHRFRDIAENMGTTTERIGSIRQALIRKDVIVEESGGAIGFRVPLSEAYVLRNRNVLMGAEVEAYRKKLAR